MSDIEGPRDVYAAAYPQYLAEGWTSPLPVGLPNEKDPIGGPGKKTAIPVGFTGYKRRVPTAEDMALWARGYPNYNIGLSMPDDMIVLDVDDHDHETGEFTGVGSALIAAWTEKYGPLPATWRSTRHPGEHTGGHYYFRLPVEFSSSSKMRDPGPGVELLRPHHRYTIVWPSVYAGLEYGWLDARGRPCEIPGIEEIPELPSSWCVALLTVRTKAGTKQIDGQASPTKAGDRTYDEALREATTRGWKIGTPQGPFDNKPRTRSACIQTVAMMRQRYLDNPDGDQALWAYAVALGRLVPHMVTEPAALRMVASAVAEARDEKAAAL